MIRFEETAVAIRYITTMQGFEWTPAASHTKLYGIRVYIDGFPNNAALTAHFSSKEARDTQFDLWMKDVSAHGHTHE